MTIAFTGDWLPLEAPGAAFPDGIRIGNLECAFSNDAVDAGKAYSCVLPESLMHNVALGGFAALSLANNHVYDAGAAAFDAMRRTLGSACPDIQFFGTEEKPYAEIGDAGRRIAVIGSLERCRSCGKGIFREEDVADLIRHIRGGFDAVYAYPHWGKEGEFTRWPSPRQRELARRWIDAGADGVFGSHSHVFQGREFYKGKPIYYSMGNFLFPHPESKMYEGTDVGLCVEIKDGKVEERFARNGSFVEDEVEVAALKDKADAISRPLENWTTWKWAKAVGAFNLRKNSASWQIRLRKNFARTLPKFLVWQLLPQTLLFRAAACRRS